ncbi:hypothetical protein LG3211_1666 [Lysobacter gummosus]|nr:hypothetical protein LG3211_1666 [Lysobacter gummosus]
MSAARGRVSDGARARIEVAGGAAIAGKRNRRWRSPGARRPYRCSAARNRGAARGPAPGLSRPA